MEPTSTISRSLEIPLRIFGIWPESPCVALCRLLWMFVLIAGQVFQYRYLVTNLHAVDLSDLMDGLSATLSYTLLSFKLIIFWLNQRTFDNILAMMAGDWEKNSGTDFSVRVTIDTATLSHYFSNFIVGFHVAAVTLYSISVVVFGASDQRPLILKMDLPFDSDTRFSYGLVLLAQYFYLVITACALSTLNALLIVLVLHLVGQINILHKWLTEMYSKENGFKPNLTLIRKLITKHQKIIDFSEHIETIYSNIALLLFISDTMIICCLGFLLVTLIGTPNATTIVIKSLAFYIVINLEAFMFCFAGEYLSTKSKTIGDAAYNSQWYETKIQDSRIILLLIMRSQNQLTITVGKFMDLSLERFANFVKAAASYVSVMLAMY